MSASRRQFLRIASGLAMATGKAVNTPFALSLAALSGVAAAQANDDYKALVCLYMSGGNDSHNWIVPMDAAGYADYARGRGGLALPKTSLTAIATPSQGSGRQFGTRSELWPLRSLYDEGRAAILANVGTLQGPTTRADFSAGRNLPKRLFSHNDQTSTWQALSPEGAKSGWGGRMGDALMASNAQPVFTSISPGGNAVFLSGESVSQFQVSAEGPTSIRAANTTQWVMGSSTASSALKKVLADGGTNGLQLEYKAIGQRSQDAEAILRASLASTSVLSIPAVQVTTETGARTTMDQDAVAKQLRMVAMLISIQRSLGMRRQVFMVSVPGFDTHNNHMTANAALTNRVAQAARYFYDAINALGMANQVTLFTASDFGRTLTSNGDGTDHGWGAHHLVIGGGVKGRNIYGLMPSLALGGPDDVGAGRLLPSTSVTQYAATLGKWFGVSPSDLPQILPGLNSFSSSDLGFL